MPLRRPLVQRRVSSEPRDARVASCAVSVHAVTRPAQPRPPALAASSRGGAARRRARPAVPVSLADAPLARPAGAARSLVAAARRRRSQPNSVFVARPFLCGHARGRLPRTRRRVRRSRSSPSSSAGLVERYRRRALLINLAGLGAADGLAGARLPGARRSTTDSAALRRCARGRRRSRDAGAQLRHRRARSWRCSTASRLAHARRAWRDLLPDARAQHRAADRRDRRRLRPDRARGARASCSSLIARVHLHGAAGHRRARAHARVREPLVGRARRAHPHARRARPARRAPLRRGRARSRATSPRHVGMAERDQELAHTAGLLHDIGRFALSRPRHGARRRADRGATGAAIRRHPELGADLLRDIGVYGPVARDRRRPPRAPRRQAATRAG